MTRNAKRLTVLCALAVACSAAAPAAVLAAADARTMNTVRRSAQPFTASVPCADDYYILRQLTLRNEGRNEHPQELPELPNADRGLFIGASTSLTTMTAGYVSIYEKARAALEHLADSGVLPAPWLDAMVTPEQQAGMFYDAGGAEYWLGYPYYSVDTLGFVTITMFTLRGQQARTAWTLTLDSRTGQVVSLWLSAEAPFGEVEWTDGEQAVLEHADPLPTPDKDALLAWANELGLETLGDWTEPGGSYTNALYSPNGRALLTAASHPYTADGGTYWYLSMAVTPETDLP